MRKLHVRQKRRANLITLVHITADWVKFFLRSRQFYRFFQAYGSFSLTAFSADVIVLEKKLPKLVVTHGVNSFACSYRILNGFLFGKSRLTNGLRQTHPLRSQTHEAINAGLMTNSPADHEALEELGPNNMTYDRVTYAYDQGEDLHNTEDEISELTNTLFTCNLNYAESTRQIIIHLALLNALTQ